MDRAGSCCVGVGVRDGAEHGVPGQCVVESGQAFGECGALVARPAREGLEEQGTPSVRLSPWTQGWRREGELQPVRKTQADRWATHLTAARQFPAREGHLRVPRKHVEDVAGAGGEDVGLRLGGWLDNTLRKADKLAPERRAELGSVFKRILPRVGMTRD
ncbi:helicase associated domain-containing protein [Streptomyces sp. NPDC055109]